MKKVLLCAMMISTAASANLTWNNVPYAGNTTVVTPSYNGYMTSNGNSYVKYGNDYMFGNNGSSAVRLDQNTWRGHDGSTSTRHGNTTTIRNADGSIRANCFEIYGSVNCR